MGKNKTEVRNFVCLKCKHRFMLDTYDEGLYGIWHLRCNRCGRKAIVNTSKDELWERINERVNEKYATYTDSDYSRHGDNHPKIIELEKEFEKTCDPCTCGGTFEVRGKERCLKCFSNDIKELLPSMVDEDLVPDDRVRITHNQFKKNGQ